MAKKYNTTITTKSGKKIDLTAPIGAASADNTKKTAVLPAPGMVKNSGAAQASSPTAALPLPAPGKVVFGDTGSKTIGAISLPLPAKVREIETSTAITAPKKEKTTADMVKDFTVYLQDVYALQETEQAKRRSTGEKRRYTGELAVRGAALRDYFSQNSGSLPNNAYQLIMNALDDSDGYVRDTDTRLRLQEFEQWEQAISRLSKRMSGSMEGYRTGEEAAGKGKKWSGEAQALAKQGLELLADFRDNEEAYREYFERYADFYQPGVYESIMASLGNAGQYLAGVKPGAKRYADYWGQFEGWTEKEYEQFRDMRPEEYAELEGKADALDAEANRLLSEIPIDNADGFALDDPVSAQKRRQAANKKKQAEDIRAYYHKVTQLIKKTNGEDTDFNGWQFAGDCAWNFLRQISLMCSSFLNYIEQNTIGEIADFLVNVHGGVGMIDGITGEDARNSLPFHQMYEQSKSDAAKEYARAQKNIENIQNSTLRSLGKDVYETAGSLGPATVMAAAAIATSGASALAGASTETLASAAYLEANPGLINTLSNALATMTKDPNYWTSFMMTVGSDYDEALQDGASVGQAFVYATTTSLLNAAIEIGGETGNAGIQSLYSKSANTVGTRTFIKDYVMSALDEGKEEVLQGLVSRTMQNITYGKGNPVFSTTDENAIFNPITAAEEFKGGAVVGALLGAVQPGVVKLLQSGQYAAAGKELTGTKTAAQREAITQELIRLAQASADTETQDFAAKAEAKFAETGKLSNADIGRLYADVYSTVAAQSSSINTNPTGHTPEEIRIIEEYKGAVDHTLVAFYNEAKEITEAKKGAPTFELNPVGDEAAKKIYDATGVDPTGFRTIIDQKQANHIYLDHGVRGKSDHSMADDNDVGRIQYVLDNYDSIEPWGRTSAYSEPNDRGGTRTAKTVKISKKVDGTYFVVEAVPDTQAKTVYIVSAYMLANGKAALVGNDARKNTGANQRLADANMPQRHGRTATIDSTPANLIIPTSSEKSNSENLEDRSLPAPGKDSPSAAEGGSSPEGGAIAKRLTAPGMESVLALGESGTRGFQKTLADAERSGASVKQAAEAYARVYNAVLSGEDVQQAKQDAAKEIPQNMIEAAQAAAEADAERKAQAAYKGKDAILVRDKYLRKANLKSRDIRILDALAKVTGVQIRFVEQLGGGDYNASYKDGAIQIALDAKDPVRTAITHELIHRIRETAPEAYAQMARFVQQNMSELHLSEEMQRRAELYETTDPSRVSEETIADAFGYILGDSEAMERFASQNRTLGQKIRDALHDLVQKIRTLLSGKGEKALDEAQRAMYRDLEGRTEEMARLFDAALEKVRANGETVIAKNNAEGYNENTKFSKKNTEGTVIRDFLRNYSGRVIEGDAVYLTRSELKRIGSAIKSGYAQFDIDGKTGSVSLEHFCYFFETVGNDVRVIDDIRNEELNIHKAVNEEEYSDGRADGNQAAYESVEAERNGQGDGAEHFVESADGKQSGKVDAVDERKTERYGDGSAGGVEKTSQRDITQNQEHELKASRKITTDPTAEIEAIRKEIARLDSNAYKHELLDNGGENALRENRKKIDALQKRLDRLQGKPQQPSRRTARETAKSKPVTSQKQLRQELISMFSVGDGSKRVVGMIVDEVAERMLREGRVDEDLRNALFSSLYASGVMTQEADEYYKDARSIVEGGKVYVSESVRADFGDDWPDFRKRAFAAGVYLTSDKGARGIDTRYKEAAEMFPGLFSEDELDMRTMLEQMVDVAEKGREKKVSLEEYNRDMAKRGYFTEEEVMTDLERQMDAALRKFADKAGLEVFLRDKTARELSAERQQRAETMRRQRETRELKEMQQKTLKQLQWLNRNRNKAPEELRGAIDDVLGDLDLYAVSAANEMNWSEKYQATWRDLAKMYKAAQANDPNFLPSKELEKIMSRISDPKIEDMDADTLSDLYRAAVALRTELYNRKNIIGEMEGQLFSEAYGDVTGELERVRDKRKGKAYNPKGTETFFNDEQLTPINVIERMAGWNPRSRLYEFGKQLVRGEQAVRAYEVEAKQMLAGFLEAHKDWVKRADGQGKNAIWYEVKVPELLGGLEVGKVPEFGKTISVWMTPAQKVHLYLESKNTDNLRHIAYGGRTFADRSLYEQGKRQNAFAQGKTVRLAPETVKSIVSDLTAEEKALADVLEAYYNRFASKRINKVSNALYGYDKAISKTYAPIYTNANYNKHEVGIYDVTAEGAGNLKERTFGTNPTYNIGAFDAWEQHTTKTARFVGMAIPARNWQTLLNWQTRGNSMRDEITHTWGKVGTEYLDNLLERLQAGGRVEAGTVIEELPGKLLSNYIGATFGANPGIVFKQAASYPQVAAVLGWSSMPSPAQMAKVNSKLISTYTKELDYRQLGYATPETAALKNNPNGITSTKIGNFLFGGGAITAMDAATVKRIWPWAENYVKQQFPGLEMGTQAEIEAGQSPFYQKVADVFLDAVTTTQPMYDEMHRANIMKSKNSLVRAFTLFKTVPLQQYNTLRRAFGELGYYQENGNSAEKKRAARTAANAVTGTLAAVAMLEAVEMAFQFLKNKGKNYRDDDDEITAESVLKALGLKAFEDSAGMVIGGKELAGLLENRLLGKKWYGIEIPGGEQLNEVADMVLNTFDSIGKFIGGWWTVEADGGNVGEYWRRHGSELYGALKDAAKKGIAYSTAFPAENIERYALGVMQWLSPELYTGYQDFFGGTNKTKMKGLPGGAAVQRTSDILTNRGISSSKSTAEEIAHLYGAGYKAVIPTDTPKRFTVNGEEISLNTKQQQDFDLKLQEVVSGQLDRIVKSQDYEALPDERRAKLIERLYDYALEVAKRDVNAIFEPEKWAQSVDRAYVAGVDVGTYLITQQKYLNAAEKGGMNDDAASAFATRMTNAELLGAEYALEEYDRENGTMIAYSADALYDQGVSYETTFRYVFAIKAGKSNAEKQSVLLAADIKDEDKALLYKEFVSGSEKELLQIAAFDEIGLPFNDFLRWKLETADMNQEEIMERIHKMPLTAAQKDTVFCSIYSESSLKKTPWHSGALPAPGKKVQSKSTKTEALPLPAPGKQELPKLELPKLELPVLKLPAP